jgi:alpha-tubulin suppressor-like RCC1 family protein
VWGRNEKGQLGLGDALNRGHPVLCVALAASQVVAAACGRHHTVFADAAGAAFAAGLNAAGQLGLGELKRVKGGEDVRLSPERVKLPGVHAAAVACGAEFSAVVSGGGAAAGQVWTWGAPQHGQLGHGSDHQYNAAESSIKMVFEPQPTPALVAGLAGKTVTGLAAGHNHSVAVCSDGGVWTWGCGDYGRLGHRVQQDEFKPRLVETLAGRVAVPADAVVAAGGTSSFVTTAGGQIYAWGKLKASGDNLMYPTPYMDLAGWKIRSMACGGATFAVASEASAITWGQAVGHGELGYGPAGKKSSACPDKVEALEGARVQQVAMGTGHTLFLADAGHPRVDGAPTWGAPADKVVDTTAPAVGGPGGAAKGGAKGKKAPPAKGAGIKKAAPKKK